MKTKNIWLLMTLTAVMAFIGCSESGLTGTWMGYDGNDWEIKFDNKNWEDSYDGNSFTKGTYTTSGKSLTRIVTHIYGNSFDRALESKWYTIAEIEETGLFDEGFFADWTTTSTFSVNNHAFVQVFEDGSTYVYARKQENISKGDITGIWVIDGMGVSVRITNIGWEITIPSYNYMDTGTYERDGTHGRLTSDTAGSMVGTADLLNENFMSVTLNQYTIAPGTHLLRRESFVINRDLAPPEPRGD